MGNLDQGSSTPNIPVAPDPNVVANTQADLNKAAGTESQAGSMVNQSNPFGSLSYTQTGTGPNGVPIYSANTSYNPQIQSILNTLWGGTAGMLNNPNYAPGADPSKIIGDATSGNTKALMDQQMAFLDPFFAQQTQGNDNTLRNQGIMPGPGGNPTNPSAYDTSMNNLRQSQGQTVAGYAAQIEPAMYQQALQNYLTPLQTAQTMYGMAGAAPGMLNSSFINTPGLNIAPPNYQQAVANNNQFNQQNYQSQVQQNENYMNGLFGMGSSVLGGLARNPGVTSAIGSGASALGTAMLPFLL